jgi:tripartite-type tricarboxylate transporter receptor subunit TctC
MAASAHADTYPDRPIRMVVPYSPGSGIDILARAVGQKMSESLGQSVVVDNRAGASGTIGTKVAKLAAPDGYTLMMTVSGHVINPHIFKTAANYDPIKDFTPISLTAWGRLLLVVNPKTGIKTLSQFMAEAKAHPGRLTYATPGTGTPHHLAMELFRGVAGIDVLHVPYSSTAGATTGILAGDVDAMFMPIHIALPHVRAGKLTVLGLASPQRAASAPDIPTLAEQGYPGAEADMWYGLLGPAGMPPAIVDKLNKAVKEALADPEIRTTLEKQGLETGRSTPAELGDLMAKEYVKWGKVIERAHIESQ